MTEEQLHIFFLRLDERLAWDNYRMSSYRPPAATPTRPEAKPAKRSPFRVVSVGFSRNRHS